MTALAKAYTRGRGFGETLCDVAVVPNDEISAVIVTAAARLAANRWQLPNDQPVGTHASRVFRGAFTGWSTAELSALNRYRKRAM